MRIFGLLLLGYTNFSLALGLGDISLKSHLGEPLVASINVTDVEKSADSGCFSVRDNSDNPAFKKASIVFKQTNSDYKLYISTHDVINEPIVNLHIAFNCETNIEREYVVLLDPAAIANLSTMDDATQTNNNNSNGIINKKLTDTLGSSTVAEPVRDAPALKKQKPKKKRVSSTSEIDKKLMEAYTGKNSSINTLNNNNDPQNNSVAKQEAPEKVNIQPKVADSSLSKPYLVISSGSLNSSESGSLPAIALRLETEIDFTRSQTDEPLTTTEASDEVTVMANRLAHLEKQIASLQNRNAQLQSEATKAREEAKNVNLFSNQRLSWFNYLLLGICLLALLFAGEWIRRKAIRKKLDHKEALWFEGKENKSLESDASIFSLNTTDDDNESLLDENEFAATIGNPLNDSNSDALMINENATDEHENILENADVFIEHDRPLLAIQLLQNHLSDFPSESPKIWLKLLSLIASYGSQAEYDQTVFDCKQFFNIKMPSFLEAAADDSSSIEDFPHILAKLEGVWGSQYAVNFLNDLIYNQQSQPREGFGRSTFEELFFLKQVAEILSAYVSKEQLNFYKPALVGPKLDNLAFNKETFLDNSINSTSFQNASSYEVEMLPTLDEASNKKISSDNKALLNDELIVGINAPTPTDAQAFDKTLQAEEIKFTEAEFMKSELSDFTDNENIFDISEPNTNNLNVELEPPRKPAKKSNVIEWDLPEKVK